MSDISQIDTQRYLEDCDTILLDMDGTLLDLAFDNMLWMETVPAEYARQQQISEDEARLRLYAVMKALQGTLDWYCLDYWSDRLELDIAGIHREQNGRIGYLPGAERFLRVLRQSGKRMVLATNSHRTTLELKNEVTGLTQYFDAIYTSHDVGTPKEEQGYWEFVGDAEDISPNNTLFVDDNVSVLSSARQFGLQKLVAVTRPDMRNPAREIDEFASVERVEMMLPP